MKVWHKLSSRESQHLLKLKLIISKEVYDFEVTWNVKSSDCQRIHFLKSLVLGGTLLQLLETLGDVEREVDQDSVRLGLDLVGAEEDVGLEVVERLVNDVRLLRDRKTRGRATCRSLDRK